MKINRSCFDDGLLYDCSHEIKRCLLLGRKVMTNLDSIFKNRDITLPTKVCLVKASQGHYVIKILKLFKANAEIKDCDSVGGKTSDSLSGVQVRCDVRKEM